MVVDRSSGIADRREPLTMAEERETANSVDPTARSESTAEPERDSEDATESEAESEATDGETVPDRVDQERPDDANLDGLADGCGCAEVWEHMTEQRGESE